MAFTVLLWLTSCNMADRKEVIALRDIPAAGQQILSTCFPDNKVSLVLKETELFEIEYEIRFEDGKEVVLDADGAWKKIDCRKNAVPETLIPVEILEKVQASFPGAAVVEIEKDGRGFEVELSNGLDLKFNSKFRMVIDD